jgi:hypothetical protein
VKQAVLDILAKLIEHRFSVVAERNKQFIWPTGSVIADMYLPAPLHCLVQLDDAAHCTRQRAAVIRGYLPETPLNYDVRRYLADTRDGDPALAQADAQADLLPLQHGFNPTVRIRFDEITTPLEDCIVSLLAKRFAYHAGTTFQSMLDNAGAKPHSTDLWKNL